MEARVSSKNSTIDRSKISGRSDGMVLKALRGLERVSPSLAARVAVDWMFRTRRGRVEAWERVLLEDAERFSLDGPAGPLAVYRFGRGPLVLLVHGWNGRATQLGAFVPALVSAGYQVVAFDAPGHGASGGSRSSIVAFANAFDTVVDAVRPFCQPIHGVVTHSLGGSAVAFAMGRALAEEERGGDAAFSRTRLVFIAPPTDMLEVTGQFSTALGLGAETLTAMQRVAEQRLRTRFEEANTLRLASTINLPLLVLHDREDRAVSIEHGRRLAEAWPDAELGVTSGLGHNRILRDENIVRRATNFIREGKTGAS
jgi:pimeloyl-ACP methyl ester carboxylesterase